MWQRGNAEVSEGRETFHKYESTLTPCMDGEIAGDEMFARRGPNEKANGNAQHSSCSHNSARPRYAECEKMLLPGPVASTSAWQFRRKAECGNALADREAREFAIIRLCGH